ncbi:hypothetical protein KY361_07530 [Candidatus Woesearchaeota archaeon]|nr:hypothetical protein [Candidatus Woesearchaeota archaeon]
MKDYEIKRKHIEYQSQIFENEELNAKDYREIKSIERAKLKLCDARARRKKENFELNNKIRRLYGRSEVMSEEDIDREFLRKGNPK